MTGPGADAEAPAPGLFSALRVRAFRVLLLALLGANTALWLHTVVAQWVLTVGGASPAAVAGVQAALVLPFLVLALPVGHVVDSRGAGRMIPGAMAAMALASAGLALVAARGPVGSWLLIAATAVLGCGLVLCIVGWQNRMPQLVGRERMGSAATLDGMVFNGARAIGPAVGGLLLAFLGAAWVFAVDALIFAAAAAICTRFPTPVRSDATPPGSMGPAVRGGVRFVRHSPWMRRTLLRLVLFSLPAAAFWALFPVIAHDVIGLGTVEFGLAFLVIGAGAVLGPALVQPVRRRWPVNVFVAVGCTGYAAGLVLVALDVPVAVLVVALFVIGTAWVTVQSAWLTGAHRVLPDWVRARSIALILVVHQVCQGGGALLWGWIADGLGVRTTAVIAGGVMAAAALTAVRWGMLPVDGMDPSAAPSQFRNPVGDDRRAVLLVVEYRVDPCGVEPFMAALRLLEGTRRRLGAERWAAWREEGGPGHGGDAVLVVETFRMRSLVEWADVQSRRWTVAERRLLDDVLRHALAAPGFRILVET
ncbi:MFS transporter [Nakamurella sp. YIM 132087]|uniref:MFS transporter n=1 Tax=Nakamurella alba TaxID=2665158 RepID=A0A7K1FSZ3_9ACTN|nr:MFS transporter [Nakamurella alba]MTD17248.1 MFS transporter [Nakamurella alba]